MAKLPEYFELFVGNGYETLELLWELSDPKELEEIGIINAQHQNRILSLIANRDRDDSQAPTRIGQGRVTLEALTCEGENDAK